MVFELKVDSTLCRRKDGKVLLLFPGNFVNLGDVLCK